MVQFRPIAREIVAKIVYYGPPLGGKTTNLKMLWEGYPPEIRGELVVLPTGVDRTIYFDYLPLTFRKLRGLDVKIQLYTVPGQVRFDSTRQVVLKGVDGVVFVADSQRQLLSGNRESWVNLKKNLALQGLFLNQLPHVLQYNKRDLSDILPVEELDAELNEFNAPFFEAVAVQGIGVEETLQGIVRLVIRSLRDRFNLGPEAQAEPRLVGAPPPEVSARAAEVKPQAVADDRQTGRVVVQPFPVPGPEITPPTLPLSGSRRPDELAHKAQLISPPTVPRGAKAESQAQSFGLGKEPLALEELSSPLATAPWEPSGAKVFQQHFPVSQGEAEKPPTPPQGEAKGPGEALAAPPEPPNPPAGEFAAVSVAPQIRAPELAAAPPHGELAARSEGKVESGAQVFEHELVFGETPPGPSELAFFPAEEPQFSQSPVASSWGEPFALEEPPAPPWPQADALTPLVPGEKTTEAGSQELSAQLQAGEREAAVLGRLEQGPDVSPPPQKPSAQGLTTEPMFPPTPPREAKDEVVIGEAVVFGGEDLEPFPAASTAPLAGEDVFALVAAPTTEVVTPAVTLERVLPRAVARHGELRELEVEVPVPAIWVGGRRVTLQLRLVLVPEEEQYES